MTKWLLGDYSAADFEQVEQGLEAAIKIEREELRATYITMVCNEAQNSLSGDEEREYSCTHPLTALLLSLRNEVEGAATRAEIHEEASMQENADVNQEEDEERDQEEEEEEAQLDQERTPTTKLQIAALSEMMRKMYQHMTLLSMEVQKLKKGQNENPQGPALSTRIGQRTDAGQSLNPNAQPFRHVNFQDTFTFLGMNSSSPGQEAAQSPFEQIQVLQNNLAEKEKALEEQQVRFQKLLQEQRERFAQQVEELRRSSAILGGQAANQPNTPPRRVWEGGVPSNSDSRHNESHSMGNHRQSDHRDIGQIVRRWNVRFAGEKGESIDLFLTRVEECRILAQLSETEVLASLSELLTGVAATWFRNGRHQWSTWAEFRTAAQRWYGTSRRQQQRLMAEANSRTQGEKEPVREYFTCIQAILRRIAPPLDVGCQIDIMHANMDPDLQCMIPRDGLHDIESLIEKAIDAELTLEAKRAYRPPPAPESCIMPEAAYKPKQTQQKKKAASANSTTKVAAVTPDPFAEAIKTITEKMDQMMKRFNSNKPNAQKRKQGNQKGNGQKKKEKDNKSDSGSESGKKGPKEKRGPIPQKLKLK